MRKLNIFFNNDVDQLYENVEFNLFFFLFQLLVLDDKINVLVILLMKIDL